MGKPRTSDCYRHMAQKNTILSSNRCLPGQDTRFHFSIDVIASVKDGRQTVKEIVCEHYNLHILYLACKLMSVNTDL